jgi:hypothetical protein
MLNNFVIENSVKSNMTFGRKLGAFLVLLESP